MNKKILDKQLDFLEQIIVNEIKKGTIKKETLKDTIESDILFALLLEKKTIDKAIKTFDNNRTEYTNYFYNKLNGDLK